MDEKHSFLVKKLKGQNGKAFARIADRLPITKKVIEALEHAGVLPVNQQIIGFVQSLIFQNTPLNSEDVFIQTLYEKKSENTHFQRLYTLWHEKKYEEFVVSLAEQNGYFAYFVNPVNTCFDPDIQKERQNAIEVFFEQNERLCTFYDPLGRYHKNYIVNFVHKDLIQDLQACKKALEEHDYQELRRQFLYNAKAIEREKLFYEKRDGRYSTSVMTIQIPKKGGRIFITSRYNHGIRNPDTTLDCNPDNIALGLSLGLKKALQVDFNDVKLPNNFIITRDNHLVQYHTSVCDKARGCTLYFGQSCMVQDDFLIPFEVQNQVCVEDIIINLKDAVVTSPTSSKLAELLNRELAPQGKKSSSKKTKLSLAKNKKEIWIQSNGHSFKPFLKFHRGKITHLYLWASEVLPAETLMHLPELKMCHGYALQHIEAYNFVDCPQLSEGVFPKLHVVENDCFRNSNLTIQAPLLIWDKSYVSSKNTPNSLGFLQNIEGVNASLSQIIGREVHGRNYKILREEEKTMIVAEDIPLVVLQNNQITLLNLPRITHLPAETICGLQFLEVFNAPNLIADKGDNFPWCQNLKVLHAPKLIPERKRPCLKKDFVKLDDLLNNFSDFLSVKSSGKALREICTIRIEENSSLEPVFLSCQKTNAVKEKNIDKK